MIQVVHRALNILEVIANSPQVSFSLSEIADTLHLNHATCANILKTLVNRNYVEQEGMKKGYRLGYMAFQLTAPNSYQTELKEIAIPLIDRLRDKINETVILSIVEGGKRLLIYHAECNHEVQVRTTQETSAYRATTGRIILAHYPPKKLDHFIKTYNMPTDKDWPEVRTKDDLIKALSEIKEKEIEITSNSNHVVSLATLIYKNKSIIASLGIYLPDIRYNKKVEAFLTKELLDTTRQINNELERQD